MSNAIKVTAYPSGASEFTPGFEWGSCYLIFSFIYMVCRSLFVLLYFFSLVIALSVLLRYTDSDYLPLVSSNSSYPCIRETGLGFSNCSNNKWAWRGDLNLVREIIIIFSNNYITLFRNSNKNVDIKFSSRDAFLE